MTDSSATIKRIMVPLDLGRLSEGKVPHAEVQARAFGAEIILLHVIPSAAPDAGGVSVEESQALAYLNAIAARLRSEGIEAHSLVHYGAVAEVIIREVARQEVDLLVLGKNVRHGLPRLIMGSVAEDVIARAPCPVLLVQPNVAGAEKLLPVRSFDEDVARTGPVAPRELGLRTVAITRIVGSVGRAAALDANFRVRNPGVGERRRYERVRELVEQGAPLPPVVLYKLGYGYYVLDGNHRVAAAKELGQLEVDAEVTEFVPLEDPQTQRVFIERRAFEEATGLTRVGAALPGHYPRLQAMARDFARQHGIDDLREAASMWEAQVYRPVARRIRALRLGQFFPDQRTADVFVQIADYREQESESEGRPIEWEEAIERFRTLHASGETA